MPRTCLACSSSERAAIDEALLSGEPLRNIAERVSLSTTSLFRHKAHLSETLKRSREAAEVSRADSLIEQLKQLTKDARRIQEKAEAQKDYRVALAGVRELTRLVELAAKVTGELAGQQVNVQTNVVPDSNGRFIPNAVLCRHAARFLRSVYGLNSDGQDPIWVITEKNAEELARKLRGIYGSPVTADEAVKMANDGFILEEAEVGTSALTTAAEAPTNRPTITQNNDWNSES
ncbi:MAG: hypothetical protein WBC04_18445 [Candidatus Acidiferrales bacterium]